MLATVIRGSRAHVHPSRYVSLASSWWRIVYSRMCCLCGFQAGVIWGVWRVAQLGGEGAVVRRAAGLSISSARGAGWKAIASALFGGVVGLLRASCC